MRPITVLLTVPVVALLTQPFWAPQWGAGVLGEVAALGLTGSIVAVAVFFGLVALYCHSLQQLLWAVPPEHRTRSPRSVWLMFAIPLNFIEDFFIVHDLASSLHRHGVTPLEQRRGWLVLGLSWAALQLASLLPGTVGLASGLLAIVAWLAHWVLTVRIRRALVAS